MLTKRIEARIDGLQAALTDIAQQIQVNAQQVQQDVHQQHQRLDVIAVNVERPAIPVTTNQDMYYYGNQQKTQTYSLIDLDDWPKVTIGMMVRNDGY